MRLINADELFSKVGDIKPANSQQYHDITDFMNMITNQPTVQAVPIEVLEELRTEIDREGDYYDTNIDQDVAKGLYKAVQIIDRKISEVSE